MTDRVPYFLPNEDEVDLIALRYVLREAQCVVRATMEEVPSDEGYREHMQRALDDRAEAHLGRIAARDCIRFEGEKPLEEAHRFLVERQYSMFAMHPDTAEQVIKAIEFVIKHCGPRLRVSTRPTRIEPKTVRNGPSKDNEEKSNG